MRKRLAATSQVGNSGDDARFSRIAHLVRDMEPVPACCLIGAHGLPRIGDDEATFFREPVHTRPHCKVVGVLSATVEHNQQRQLTAILLAWDVDLVLP